MRNGKENRKYKPYARAKEKILVVDDSKIGKVTFARIAALTDFNVLVTNYAEENMETLARIEALGLKVVVV